MKINRKEVRQALAEYKEAERQTKLFFNDPKVKELHEIEYALLDEDKIEESLVIDEQIQEIRKEKYPIGSWVMVHNKAKALVETMMENIPHFDKNTNIMNDVVFKPELLKEFVELAERT